MTTLIVTLLPFLILIALVLAVVLVIRKTSKSRNLSASKGLLFLKVYIIILLVGIVAYYMIPQDTKAYLTDNMTEGVELVRDNRYEIQSLEELNQLNALEVEEKWFLPYENNEMLIKSNNLEYSGTPIYVERVDTEDNRIEVIRYVSKKVLEGISLPSSELILDGNTLSVTEPPYIHLNLAMFGKTLTSSQFDKENIMDLRVSGLVSAEIYYLQIPKDIKLSGDVYLLK
ncbi:hypothetical protein [Aquibacillus kalidii]|uniref:hypothetical protein n=1 Tax=Aquibacillus kalidii TaxID=2762597 RepID=UPI001645A90A|nr:hypothetical protein [Aquibacillus kalidii]